MSKLISNIKELPWKESKWNLITFFLISLITIIFFQFVVPLAPEGVFQLSIRTAIFLLFISTMLIFFNPFSKKSLDCRENRERPIRHYIISLSIVVFMSFIQYAVAAIGLNISFHTIPPMVFIMILAGAVSEELLFKGLLLPLLIPNKNPDPSISKSARPQASSYWLISTAISIIFSLYHVPQSFGHILALFLGSMLSFLIFYFWPSLILVIVYHLIHNLFTFSVTGRI